jgi:hypothetical protein
MKLTDYAFPFDRQKDTVIWQHNETNQVFQTVERTDGTYYLSILNSGKWQDEGIKTINQLIYIASHLN